MVADIWAGICQDDIAGFVEATRMAITQMCGKVGTFSIDMVDNLGTTVEGTATAGMPPITSVEPGMPHMVVDAWNHNKVVCLVELLQSGLCRGAIKAEVSATVKDFRACSLLKGNVLPGHIKVPRLGGWNCRLMEISFLPLPPTR